MGLFDRLFGGAAAIAPAEALRLMEAGSAVVLDVREPEEYAEGHIPGAVNLPLGSVRAAANARLPDRDKTLIVYCLSGGRSATACSILQTLGYTRVFNLGGIGKWPYEIEA